MWEEVELVLAMIWWFDLFMKGFELPVLPPAHAGVAAEREDGEDVASEGRWSPPPGSGGLVLAPQGWIQIQKKN